MKKILLFLISASVCGLCAGGNGGIPEFKDVTGSSSAAEDFFVGFEPHEKIARLEPGFELVRGEGINGNRALKYSADKERPRAVTQKFKIKLKKNWNYRLTVHFRLENMVNHDLWLAKKTEFALTGIDFLGAGNKYVAGRYRSIHVKEGDPKYNEYQVYETEFNTPEEFDHALLHLYLGGKWTGSIYYDDVQISALGAAPSRVYQIQPALLRCAKDGSVVMRVDNMDRGKESDLRLLVDFKGNKKLFPVRNGRAKIRFEKLAKGKNDYKAAVVNIKTRELFGWHNLSVFKTVQDTGMNIDAKGFFWKDGKKYFPVGVFAHTRLLRGHHLPELSANGINFVMCYRGENLKVAGVGLANALRLRAGLDLFHKHNMTLLFALNGHLKSRKSFEKFAGAVGYENSIRKIAAVLKNHPGLFGWYISDENPRRDLPEVALLRNLLTEGDGRHAVATLTNKARDVAEFAHTGDFIMLDDYPFVNEKTQSMSSSRKLIDANKDTGIPSIFVPQAFHWGAYRKPADPYRFPTEQEIRSQSLLAMILGCRGICFYSYTSILERQENAFPGTTKAFLAGLFRISRMLRELEGFFLSEEAAPQVKVSNKKSSRVDAKAFVNGGRIIVPVTADGPGDAEAVISIKGLKKPLKSRFGFTVRNSDGNYIFKAKDVASDILEGEL